MNKMLRSIIRAMALLGMVGSAWATNFVRVSGFTFVPKDLTVAVGDTVVFSGGNNFHTVTGDGAEAFCGFDSFTTCSVTFEQLGTFDYHCIPHAARGMRGVVRVVSGVTSPLTVAINGRGTVTPDLNGQSLFVGGQYTLTARPVAGFSFVNWTGGLTSNLPTLTFVMQSNLVLEANFADRARPVLTILAPAANARLTNASVPARGTASDNDRVARVEYQLENADGLSDFQPALGTTNWEAALHLAIGTNRFRVRATDPSGTNSLEAMRTVLLLAQLTVATNGPGTVPGFVGTTFREAGKSFTLTATPGKGFVFTNWTGGILASTNRLTFVLRSNLVLTANFVPNPFLALKGTYNGLFNPMPGEPSHDNSGLFTLTLTDKGAFTGKLLLAGATHSLSGQFDLGLHAHKTVTRGTNTPVVVDLQLVAGSDQIVGSVSNAAWVAELGGYRATFNASTNPATNFVNKYTLLFSGGADAAKSPFGQGFATLMVNNAGSVTIKGTLADNTVAMQTVPVASNGQVPLYVNLYGGKGSIFGWLTFTNTLTNCIDGLLLWTKKGGGSGPFYTMGFTNDVITLGSPYATPPLGTPALMFSNAVVLLGGGNLSSNLTNDVRLSALNKITVTSTNTNKLVLTLTLPSGQLTGSFLNPDTKKSSPIKGVVLQKRDAGGGFFLGTNQSGAAYFGPPSHFPLFHEPPPSSSSSSSLSSSKL